MSEARKGRPLRIAASEKNAWNEASQKVLGGLPGGNFHPGRMQTQEWMSVRVKNTSGADRDRFDVLAIDDMVFNLTDNKEASIAEPCLELRQIEGSADRGNVVVLLQPLKQTGANAFGFGVFAGLTAAYVDVESSTHTSIDVGDEVDAFVSRSGGGGIGRIVWKPSGTGRVLCMVLITGGGSDGRLYGFELTTVIEAADQTASATIYELNGAVFGDSLGVETIYDPAQWYGRAEIGTRGLCQLQDGKYYAKQSGCGPLDDYLGGPGDPVDPTPPPPLPPA